MPKLVLRPHQKIAVEKLRSGSILCGGVGSGKSLTALSYFFEKECGGSFDENGEINAPSRGMPLYIITTARKRDTFEWEHELRYFLISTNPKISLPGIYATIDSWNNVHKYVDVKNAFFIFDEQRVVGSGQWVKSFLKIAKANRWILLSATPGDSWMDYIPVFIANGFYKNRTEFLNRHAVWSIFPTYRKVERWIDTSRLEILRRRIVVDMPFHRATASHVVNMTCDYNEDAYSLIVKKRWNPYEEKPIENISELCYLLRKAANGHEDRVRKVHELMEKHKRIIIFYNFDYELEMLLPLKDYIFTAQWNGHRHDPIPKTDEWLYFVQYNAGAEGWNCIDTNAIVFFSQNYSYKTMLQAAGRIDRMNTPFTDLYYYIFHSRAPIDQSITKALSKKQSFNEKLFFEKSLSRAEHGLL